MEKKYWLIKVYFYLGKKKELKMNTSKEVKNKIQKPTEDTKETLHFKGEQQNGFYFTRKVSHFDLLCKNYVHIEKLMKQMRIRLFSFNLHDLKKTKTKKTLYVQ